MRISIDITRLLPALRRRPDCAPGSREVECHQHFLASLFFGSILYTERVGSALTSKGPVYTFYSTISFHDLDHACRRRDDWVVPFVMVHWHLGLERSVGQSLSFEHLSDSISTSRRRYVVKPHSPTASAETDAVEGVSILRPLKGLDPNIYENLETSFLQVYPKFEIIFAVADEGDQALAVVRELIAKYPRVDARIITSTSPVRSCMFFFPLISNQVNK